jgi:DNA polymerase-4
VARRTEASILHVDLDAFFASVEQLLDPALAGRPVVVGGLGPRGVVSAASYEARAHGVHSAMPMARARRACPGAVFLPPRFEHYEEKSREVMAILRSVSPLVEPLSIDEAFVDASGSRRRLGAAEEVGALVRRRIRDETGLVASVGVATTKFLAKVASDLAKPDGLLTVAPGAEHAFLAALPVSRLWGVGPRTLAKLERIGVHTIGDVAALPVAALTAAVGAANGAHLHALARNDDPREVVTTRAVKSIGAEETFPRDLTTTADVEHELVRLADRVTRRLRASGVRARTVTLKARYGDFSTVTRARTLPAPTALSTVLLATARSLLADVDVGRGLRLVGISASQLVEPAREQAVLVAPDDAPSGADPARREAVEQAVHAVRERFGDRSIQPAALAPAPREGSGA